MTHKGLLAVISAPSGTGKGTLLRELMESDKTIRCSVSATTRSPRRDEIEGKDYFFKTIEEFEGMISGNELIEWVEYCDNYYGTPRQHVSELLKEGYNVILEIEVEGALNVKKKFPDSILIFILPPSFTELEKRIKSRGTETLDSIKKRLDKARKEIEFIHKYDYVIVNSEIKKAAEEIRCILKAESLKINRNKEIINEIGGRGQ
jgi:guanylate kinase